MTAGPAATASSAGGGLEPKARLAAVVIPPDVVAGSIRAPDPQRDVSDVATSD
jgi:hypothetical protein